jgi:anti-sigma B factor antagonist
VSGEFSLTTESIDEQRHVVAVAGELDISTAPQLKSALGDAVASGHTRIVVDLTSTSFLDSSGLGVLIGVVKRLRARDGVLAIVNTNASIAQTLELSGLDRTLAIHATRAEAVEAL